MMVMGKLLFTCIGLQQYYNDRALMRVAVPAVALKD